MKKPQPHMLGLSHAIRATQAYFYIPRPRALARPGIDASGGDLSGGDLSGNPPIFPYTYIIYGVFEEGENPNWYWCDEFGQTETPPVLASGYDGTTALRDGLAVVVSGTFYQ
jgi:hypothetical protein